MPEHYKLERTNWKTEPDKILADEMVHWGKIMGGLRMVPYVTGKGWAGNIGFRENNTIWVTPSGGVINDIKLEEIMGISEKNGDIFYCGHPEKKPTSEWEIYWGIFKERDDVNAILHGHDLFALETAERLRENYPNEVGLTKSVTESGSAEFRDEILEILTDKNIYLIGREHGFFALGKTFEEAGILALDYRSKANEIMIGGKRYKEILDKYHIG